MSTRARIPMFGLAVFFLSSFAAAQTPAAKVSGDAKSLVYDFPDDGLLGDGLAATGAKITVRPPASRASLVRPRLSFVPELLKTVESL